MGVMTGIVKRYLLLSLLVCCLAFDQDLATRLQRQQQQQRQG